MHPTTTVLTDQPPAPPAAIAPALRRRWPALLAVGVAAALWGVDTTTAGQLLPVLPLLYLVLAVVRRPQASWAALLASVVLLTALQQAQGAVDPVLATTAVAAVVALAGALRRGGRGGRGELALQVGGYVLFAGTAAVALLAAPEAARWVLAAGWLGHGVWDLVHLRRRAVVSRSYAEWCGVLDVLVAVQLIFVR